MAGKKRAKDTPTLPWLADPNAPWAQEAAHYAATAADCSEDDARDLVILRYLHKAGDTRPLVSWIMTGRAPGPAVLRYLAQMLEPDDADVEKLAYRLERKRRGEKRGRYDDPAIDWRDTLISNAVESRKAAGEKYEFALADTADWLEKIGVVAGRDTVKKAYDARRRRGEDNE